MVQIESTIINTSLQNPIVNHKSPVNGCRNATKLGGAFAGTVYTKDIPKLLKAGKVKKLSKQVRNDNFISFVSYLERINFSTLTKSHPRHAE